MERFGILFCLPEKNNLWENDCWSRYLFLLTKFCPVKQWKHWGDSAGESWRQARLWLFTNFSWWWFSNDAPKISGSNSSCCLLLKLRPDSGLANLGKLTLANCLCIYMCEIDYNSKHKTVIFINSNLVYLYLKTWEKMWIIFCLRNFVFLFNIFGSLGCCLCQCVLEAECKLLRFSSWTVPKILFCFIYLFIYFLVFSIVRPCLTGCSGMYI